MCPSARDRALLVRRQFRQCDQAGRIQLIRQMREAIRVREGPQVRKHVDNPVVRHVTLATE
jgi:hypothetical protein